MSLWPQIVKPIIMKDNHNHYSFPCVRMLGFFPKITISLKERNTPNFSFRRLRIISTYQLFSVFNVKIIGRKHLSQLLYFFFLNISLNVGNLKLAYPYARQYEV